MPFLWFSQVWSSVDVAYMSTRPVCLVAFTELPGLCLATRSRGEACAHGGCSKLACRMLDLTLSNSLEASSPARGLHLSRCHVCWVCMCTCTD